MITESILVFPNNVVDLLFTRIGLIDTDLRGFKRPLRATDPQQSYGMFGQQWLPDEDSQEMVGSAGSSEPTIGRYLIGVQAFVKDTSEERGLAVHSVLSKLIRGTLYRDIPLKLALQALTVTLNGSTERTRRFGISTQRYFSNEIAGDFLYLSTLEFWLETETI